MSDPDIDRQYVERLNRLFDLNSSQRSEISEKSEESDGKENGRQN